MAHSRAAAGVGNCLQLWQAGFELQRVCAQILAELVVAQQAQAQQESTLSRFFKQARPQAAPQPSTAAPAVH